MRIYSGLGSTLAMAVSAMGLLLTTASADAKCTRLAFSVNDYGKEGPTNDAKSLLDKHIAKWATEHGVKTYTTGKKDVTCELFLDFGVFDEHTCKAEANVCWTGIAPLADKAAAEKAAKAKAAATAAVKPKT